MSKLIWFLVQKFCCRKYSLKTSVKKNLSIIKPDLIIYLDQKIENLIMNIKKRNRDFEKSISKEYLYSIKKSYQNFLDNNSDINIIKIDNSELDFVNNKDDFKKILNTIHPYI